MTSGNLGLAKTEPLFRVSGLSVEYDAAGGDLVRALRGVDLEIADGQTVGVLGESGSGKSSLALALMRLLPRNARITDGNIHHRGRNLAEFSAKQLREMRGAEVALISQEPALALNPVRPLGTQIIDVLKAHSALKRAQLAERTKEMLRDVGFDDPERIMRAYPHQLSGGQRQRVAIAQALICRPQLLIADEPLSALDVATQAEIVELLQRLKRELNLAILFVTHNVRVLSSLVDQAIVMREGEVLAQCRISKLQSSADPYIQSLLFPERNIRAAARSPKPSGATECPLLQVRDLGKKFIQRHFFSRSKFTVQALEHIDLELQEGTTTAVLGRSGSGKSTLARCIAGFETVDSGEIMLQGRLLAPHSHNGFAHKWAERRAVQMIFQDAATSLNPRFTARQIVAEPLEIAHWKTELERAARALELMAEVGLNADWSERLAGEFSGGQRQRLALARALAAEPKLLIMDEALSGLDMPLQAQMVRLLMDLQARYGLTYLYISHDLNFISLFAQEVVVMESGKIVERLAPSQLNQGSHPATRALVEASERLHVSGAAVTA
ncbi:MAG TPA: ABC transporter ATP-binding protein [Candidatus Angelobacter sp.]|nr:ABC transporter ATP-binding protein [Candidatus Angelobacter sp.]